MRVRPRLEPTHPVAHPLHQARDRPPRLQVAVVIGTRPEGIKMAPIIRELERHQDQAEPWIVSTAQHHEMLDEVLRVFDIQPHLTLDSMRRDQTVADLAARALSGLAVHFAKHRPDVVLVQGDTATVAAAALAAFYQGIQVGHVEAGLRSFDRQRPFPEEVNRRLAGCIADLHFAPTDGARDNLLRERIPPDNIFVTGNTVVDALQSISLDGTFDNSALAFVSSLRGRLLLVTAHRRESQGPALASICDALKILVDRFQDVHVVYPVHLNPRVRNAVRSQLKSIDRVHLVNPVSYRDLLRLMRLCTLILTDSGGIQEEAPSFHKPVLVLRDVTERPELIQVGAGRLVGTNTTTIVEAATRLLQDPTAYQAMQTDSNPFGDGRAARRIVSIVLDKCA